MDTKALRDISYGLYIVSSQKDGRDAGCVVNTFAQVTSDPLQVSVAINKENFTCQAVLDSGIFETVIISEEMPIEVIRLFGFRSSATIDKFENLEVGVSEAGLKYLKDNTTARFSASVKQTLDLGSHVLFVGEVQDAEALSEETPLTYANYHTIKGGKTPPKASSYIPPEPKA